MLKEYLLNFGFTEKDYENIISTPRLYSLRNDSLYKHILEMNNYFLSFGFKKEEIIKMIRKRSSIYSQSPSSLTKKFNFLLNYGYKKEEYTHNWGFISDALNEQGNTKKKGNKYEDVFSFSEDTYSKKEKEESTFNWNFLNFINKNK